MQGFSGHNLKNIRNFSIGSGHSSLWPKAITFLCPRTSYSRPVGAGDNMHILESDRVNSGYDERSQYKTSGTKIMVVGQKYPPHNSVKKLSFAKNVHFL